MKKNDSLFHMIGSLRPCTRVALWAQGNFLILILQAESPAILSAKQLLLYFTWPLTVTLLRVYNLHIF